MKDTRLLALLLVALACGSVAALEKPATLAAAKPSPAVAAAGISSSTASKAALKPAPVVPAPSAKPAPSPKPAPVVPAPSPKPAPALTASVIPPKGAACDASKCNDLVAKYYKEINCKPVFEKDSCCPARFDCPAAASSARAEDKCYLAGVAYNPGANIPNALSGPCTTECICKQFAGKVNIHCLTTECDDAPQDCVPLFKENSCCAHSFHCKNASKVDPALPKKDFTCSYGGKTYLEGQLLLTPADPCKICTCQKGFNGSLAGSWCREKSCDLEVLHGAVVHRGCAPVFYGTSECCPASWRCPTTTDKVIPAKKSPATSAAPGKPTGVGCAFGALRLGVGDSLAPATEDEECTCSLPPHVTCARKEVAFDLDLIELQ